MSQRMVLALAKKPAKPRTAKKRQPPTVAECALKFAAAPRVPLFVPTARRGRVLAALSLPLSPSVNTYWRSWARPGSSRVMTYVANEGHAYRDAVAFRWRTHFALKVPQPTTARLRVTVAVHDAAGVVAGDLDNRMKGLLDALTRAGAWGDDSQVDELHVYRSEPVAAPGGMWVTIEAIE